VLDEALGSDDLDPPRVDIVLGHHPLHAAEMIEMAVGVDDRDHGPVTAMLAVQRQRRGGGLGRYQRVDDDDPGVAFDDAHVGQVIPADLVDPACHLEQALPGHQRGLAPQARVHRVRRVPGQEAAVGPVVPDHLARVVADNRVSGIDEPAFGGLEIGAVLERQPCTVRHSQRPFHHAVRCSPVPGETLVPLQHTQTGARQAHPRRMKEPPHAHATYCCSDRHRR
jgi:hypothetical protein